MALTSLRWPMYVHEGLLDMAILDTIQSSAEQKRVCIKKQLQILASACSHFYGPCKCLHTRIPLSCLWLLGLGQAAVAWVTVSLGGRSARCCYANERMHAAASTRARARARISGSRRGRRFFRVKCHSNYEFEEMEQAISESAFVS